MKNESYILKFDELNRLAESFNGSTDKLLSEAYDAFKGAYIAGWSYAGKGIKDPHQNRAYDDKHIEDVIFFIIEGLDPFDRLEEAHADEDTGRIAKILSTEYHRIYNTAELDRAKASGKEVNKRWETMLDDKVRETHDYLQGVSVPLDAEFVTFDGDSALYPGGFSDPENNCNCRCWLEFT